MKLLSKLVCTTVILSPLVLSGCQSIFGDSTAYTYPPHAKGYAQGHHHHGHHGATGTTVQTNKVATPTTRVVKKRATSGVPLEAPVHNAASSDNAAASASTQNANSSNAANNVVVPPAGPSTGMVAPTVQ